MGSGSGKREVGSKPETEDALKNAVVRSQMPWSVDSLTMPEKVDTPCWDKKQKDKETRLSPSACSVLIFA